MMLFVALSIFVISLGADALGADVSNALPRNIRESLILITTSIASRWRVRLPTRAVMEMMACPSTSNL